MPCLDSNRKPLAINVQCRGRVAQILICHCESRPSICIAGGMWFRFTRILAKRDNLIIFHEMTQPVPSAVRNLAPSAIQKGGHLVILDIFNRRNDTLALYKPEFDLGNTPSRCDPFTRLVQNWWLQLFFMIILRFFNSVFIYLHSFLSIPKYSGGITPKCS
jgi:hypothetical protein